ncbi:unnamed protein product [Didymodactylos carnosus]|uniref:Uncharacterized protein n=1 Tax=Didymodactylos carnosus TaxID=1234261 RepID=A0A8S2UI83_9BILA|nr:unnamed protein product [Didymodactylos carnosus]CAF4316784.1 unnamed protein product [Didymodactylos carnosus]
MRICGRRWLDDRPYVHVQDEFQRYYNDSYDKQSNHDSWSLQVAMVVVEQSFINKAPRKGRFNSGLDPQLFEDQSEKLVQRKDERATYAAMDVLAVQRLLKLTNISAQCQRAASTNTQPQTSNVTESTLSLMQPSPATVLLISSTILQSTIDQYENISDEEEQKRPLTTIYEDLSGDADIALPSPQPQFYNEISALRLETPPQTINTETQESLIIMAPDEDSLLEPVLSSRPQVAKISSRPSSPLSPCSSLSENQQLPSHGKLKSKPKLTDEQRRQKNKRMTQKQRKRQRKNEIVLNNLDYRFSFHHIKELLDTANVPYANLNTAHRNKNRHLFIALHDDTQRQKYSKLLTKYWFSRQHWEDLHPPPTHSHSSTFTTIDYSRYHRHR